MNISFANSTFIIDVELFDCEDPSCTALKILRRKSFTEDGKRVEKKYETVVPGFEED